MHDAMGQSQAIDGIQSGIASGAKKLEVEFPPIAQV